MAGGGRERLPLHGAVARERRRRPGAAPPASGRLRGCPRPGAAPRHVAEVDFDEDGGRRVCEQLPSGPVQHHVLPGGGAVRLRWERAAGRWKLWVEAGGERLVLGATFESPEPQLELHAYSIFVDYFDVSLLPPPGPGTLQSPPPAHAQLQARIDQLTAELETGKLQKAEFAQNLQKQLDELERQLTAELETEKQQKAEFAQNLQKQLDELARQKAEEMKKVEDLQKANETLQQRIAFLTQKAQKSEMTQCILQLKEQCDAFLAPQLEIMFKQKKNIWSPWSSMSRVFSHSERAWGSEGAINSEVLRFSVN